MSYYANTNEIKTEDVGFGGTSNPVSLGVGDNEWFKLGIEYCKISADEILTLVFVNGALKFTSNRCLYSNGNDDNAWPVYSNAYTTHKGKTLNGVNSIFFNAQSSTDATVYFDNSIVRRTTLTPPIIPVEDYDSYYNSTNYSLRKRKALRLNLDYILYFCTRIRKQICSDFTIKMTNDI